MCTCQVQPRSIAAKSPSHLEPEGTMPTCSICPLSQDAASSCPAGCEMISDLVSLRRYLAGHLGSDDWRQASLLVGTRISSLATSLTAGRETGLAKRILNLFCPDRLKTATPAIARFREVDLAIRAVAALAVLGRFCECLDHVKYTSRSDRFRRFSPNDLMARIASLARFSAYRRISAHSRWSDEDPLSLLVFNEANPRLGIRKMDRRLAKRVHKHMEVFRELADIAPLCGCRDERQLAAQAQSRSFDTLAAAIPPCSLG